MSVWFDLLEAHNVRVQGVAGLPVPVVRKSGQWIDGDTAPMILICAGGAEVPTEYAFTNLVKYEYPVFVLLVEEHNRDFAVKPSLLDRREDIRDVLDQRTITGASTVFDCDLEPLPPFDFKGAANTVYDVVGFKTISHSWETRAY